MLKHFAHHECVRLDPAPSLTELATIGLQARGYAGDVAGEAKVCVW